MSHNILFSLYSWKSTRKSFELIIRLESKPRYIGFDDWYDIYFVINKQGKYDSQPYNKTLAQYSSRRFTNFYNNFDSFYKTLQFHPEAQKRFMDFHTSKIDILGLKVLKVIE